MNPILSVWLMAGAISLTFAWNWGRWCYLNGSASELLFLETIPLVQLLILFFLVPLISLLFYPVVPLAFGVSTTIWIYRNPT